MLKSTRYHWRTCDSQLEWWEHAHDEIGWGSFSHWQCFCSNFHLRITLFLPHILTNERSNANYLRRHAEQYGLFRARQLMSASERYPAVSVCNDCWQQQPSCIGCKLKQLYRVWVLLIQTGTKWHWDLHLVWCCSMRRLLPVVLRILR